MRDTYTRSGWNPRIGIWRVCRRLGIMMVGRLEQNSATNGFSVISFVEIFSSSNLVLELLDFFYECVQDRVEFPDIW